MQRPTQARSAGGVTIMHAVLILWVEQFWNVHPRKLDPEIFENGPSAKIGSLENFQLDGINVNIIKICMLKRMSRTKVKGSLSCHADL